MWFNSLDLGAAAEIECVEQPRINEITRGLRAPCAYVQRAARFLYLQKLAFGGKVTGQSFGTATTSKPRWTALTLESDLEKAHYRLAQTTIEHLDWVQVIERYDRPHTLFFVDPAYWQCDGYGVEFGWEKYARLADLAATIDGHMVISNDYPDIRALFGHLPGKEIGYEYTVGGSGHTSAAVEMVYGNWEGGVPEPLNRQAAFF